MIGGSCLRGAFGTHTRSSSAVSHFCLRLLSFIKPIHSCALSSMSLCSCCWWSLFTGGHLTCLKDSHIHLHDRVRHQPLMVFLASRQVTSPPSLKKSNYRDFNVHHQNIPTLNVSFIKIEIVMVHGDFMWKGMQHNAMTVCLLLLCLLCHSPVRLPRKTQILFNVRPEYVTQICTWLSACTFSLQASVTVKQPHDILSRH